MINSIGPLTITPHQKCEHMVDDPMEIEEDYNSETDPATDHEEITSEPPSSEDEQGDDQPEWHPDDDTDPTPEEPDNNNHTPLPIPHSHHHMKTIIKHYIDNKSK